MAKGRRESAGGVGYSAYMAAVTNDVSRLMIPLRRSFRHVVTGVSVYRGGTRDQQNLVTDIT